MTSATDELRRMLDERGVEWERGLPTETIVRKPIDVLYVERPDGRMHTYVRSYFTPAQAIAATLGNDGVGRSNDGVAELEAENAKLHTQLADVTESMGRVEERCAKLRERAATLRQGRWSDGADDAGLMEDAADTIWELRDDLQRAITDNAKLRELVEDTLPVIENNCAMCAYFGECTILADCKCIALKRLRDRMRELGGRRRVEEKE